MSCMYGKTANDVMSGNPPISVRVVGLVTSER